MYIAAKKLVGAVGVTRADLPSTIPLLRTHLALERVGAHCHQSPVEGCRNTRKPLATSATMVISSAGLGPKYCLQVSSDAAQRLSASDESDVNATRSSSSPVGSIL